MSAGYEDFDWEAEELDAFNTLVIEYDGRRMQMNPLNSLLKLYEDRDYDHILHVEDGNHMVLALTEEIVEEWYALNLPIEEPRHLDDSAAAYIAKREARNLDQDLQQLLG